MAARERWEELEDDVRRRIGLLPSEEQWRPDQVCDSHYTTSVCDSPSASLSLSLDVTPSRSVLLHCDGENRWGERAPLAALIVAHQMGKGARDPSLSLIHSRIPPSLSDSTGARRLGQGDSDDAEAPRRVPNAMARLARQRRSCSEPPDIRTGRLRSRSSVVPVEPGALAFFNLEMFSCFTESRVEPHYLTHPPAHVRTVSSCSSALCSWRQR